MRKLTLWFALAMLSACAMETTTPEVEVGLTAEAVTYNQLNSYGGNICQQQTPGQCICMAAGTIEALKRTVRTGVLRWFPGVAGKWTCSANLYGAACTTSGQTHWMNLYNCASYGDGMRWCQFKYQAPTFVHEGYVGIEGACSRSSHWYANDYAQGHPAYNQLRVTP